MAGFSNDVVYGTNIDLSGGSPVAAKMLLDGQLLIGSTALNAGGTHCNINTLTAGTGISITNGAGTITITNTGGGGGGGGTESLAGDSGSASEVGGVINVFGSTGITTSGAGQTLTISPANDLAAVEAISSTGIVVRTGSETWTTRTLSAGSGITISNADGVAGNPQITAAATVPLTFTEDAGSATAALNNINIFGTSSQGITTSGASDTVTITASNATSAQKGVASFNVTNFTVTAGAVASNAITVTAGTGLTTGGSVNLGGAVTLALDIPVTVPHGGTGQTSFTTHGVLIGNGGSALNVSNAGTNGQVLIGATGGDPAFATLVGTNGITYVTGANTLTISNTAIPNSALANSTITLNNGNNITITGSPVALGGAATVNVSGCTQFAVQIGDASGALDDVAVGTNGQVLIGATGAAPAFSTLTSSNGSITFTTGAHTLDLVANTTTGSVITLTPDVGGAVSPSAGNINILGYDDGSFDIMNTHNTGSNTIKIENRVWLTPLVVDASTTVGVRGTYSTIASALTASSSGQTIFIRPGTYTEDLTLKAGVNLCAFEGDGLTPNVTIIGKVNATFSGTASISNLRLQTNSDNLLAVSGSNATIINVIFCDINASDNTGILLSSSNSSSLIFLSNCSGNIGTTGIALFSITGPGIIRARSSRFTNTGSSSTANTITNGSIDLEHTRLSNPITTSASGGCDISYSSILTSGNICVTHGGSDTAHIEWSQLTSGSAAAFSISSSAANIISNTRINSSNTNPVTGSGTVSYDNVYFSNSGVNINTTTQSPLPMGPRIALSGGCQMISGSGSPNGSVTAPKGSLWLRTDGTTTNNRAYINTNGGTTWTAITTVA